jgi:hypothetical protein
MKKEGRERAKESNFGVVRYYIFINGCMELAKSQSKYAIEFK